MKKLISGKDIPTRVLIKKIDDPIKMDSGIEIPPDKDQLPRAEIVMVTEAVGDIVRVGDIVYYLENSRDMGRCPYKGEEHFVTLIGNIIAII